MSSKCISFATSNHYLWIEFIQYDIVAYFLKHYILKEANFILLNQYRI